MKLYWHPRSRATRCIWALEEAGVPYDLELVDISAPKRGNQNFAKASPLGKVPALEDKSLWFRAPRGSSS